MKVRAKKGFELEVEIDGTVQKPIIRVAPFSVGAKRHPGSATARIQHWHDKGLDKGIFTPTPRAYIEIEKNSMREIEATIAALQPIQYMIRKQKSVISADGIEFERQTWVHDGLAFFDIDGYRVRRGQMERFLDSQGITEIERAEAMRQFKAAHDMTTLKKRAEDSQRRMAALRADDASERS